MSATLRGAIIFGGLVGFLVVCALLTFGVLPSMGIAVGLPVIMVPGEPYDPYLPVDSFRWTNTLMATALASLATLAFAFLAWRASKGWTRQVPTRFQSWVELLGGFLYGFAKQMAGKNARLVFPLVATIFVFLLATNWMKLLPGVESVGVMHCAEEGFNGYPAVQVGSGAFQLYVDQRSMRVRLPRTTRTMPATISSIMAMCTVLPARRSMRRLRALPRRRLPCVNG
ncbi:F0F1 ATP synthase subunit A [Geitlerinema splendidum]|nr:F0F1 ATP synthase subunit A [Geitlerinema splendidum]